MLHTFKVQTHTDDARGRLFAHLALILGFSNAIFWALFPAVVHELSNTDSALSNFFAFTAAISLIGAIFSTVIFKHFSRVKIFKFSLIVYALAYFFMIFANTFTMLLIIEGIRSFFNVLIWVSIALFVRDFSKLNELGRSEGRFFLFINLGFILGFFVNSVIVLFFSEKIVFIVSASLVLIAYFYFTHKHLKYNGAHIPDGIENISLKEFIFNCIDYFKDIKRIKSFILTFGHYYWLSLTAIYIPVFILKLEFGANVIGFVLAAMIIPIIFLEEIAANLSDKTNLRNFFILGFFILALSSLLLSLNFSPIWLIVILILSGAGVGLIEPLQEKIFFLSTSKKQEDHFYGVRLTAQPLAGILAPIIAGLFVSFYGFLGVWISGAIVMFILALFSLTIKK